MADLHIQRFSKTPLITVAELKSYLRKRKTELLDDMDANREDLDILIGRVAECDLLLRFIAKEV